MGHKVLVADDQLNVRNILEFNLKRHGFDVTAVGDGLSAYNTALKVRPRVIVLDLMMPGMDGFQVLERLKNWPEGEPPGVLILSARGTEQDILRALSLGAKDFIVKPFNMDVLFQKINNILSGKNPRLEKKEDEEEEDETPAERLDALNAVPSSLVAVLPVPQNLSKEGGEAFADDVMILINAGVKKILFDATVHTVGFTEFPLDLFVKILRDAQQNEAVIHWVLPESLKKIFKESGLAEIAQIYQNLDQAIHAFK